MEKQIYTNVDLIDFIDKNKNILKHFIYLTPLGISPDNFKKPT